MNTESDYADRALPQNDAAPEGDAVGESAAYDTTEYAEQRQEFVPEFSDIQPSHHWPPAPVGTTVGAEFGGGHFGVISQGQDTETPALPPA